MITRINISPEALKSVSSSTDRVAKNAHRKLVAMVRKHGAIVLESNDSAHELVRFLKQQDNALPPAVRQWWMELATEFLKLKRFTVVKPALGVSPVTVQEFSSLNRAWAEEIDVAVVDPQTAGTLGVPEDEGQRISPETGFEVVIADVATNSYHFDAIEQLIARGSLRQGESRELFWDTVLEPLWSVSRNAVVLDQYLLRGWLEKGWVSEHVQWLTRRLAHARGPLGKLTLISGNFPMAPSTFQRALDTLASLAGEGRLYSIDLALVPPGLWNPRKHAHDRHIRFESGAVMPLAGFDRLSRDKVSHEEGMNWMFRSSSTTGDREKIEALCLQAAEVTTIELVHR